jgi:hypothetical protein
MWTILRNRELNQPFTEFRESTQSVQRNHENTEIRCERTKSVQKALEYTESMQNFHEILRIYWKNCKHTRSLLKSFATSEATPC